MRKCNQTGCNEPAKYAYRWFGGEPHGICDKHGRELEAQTNRGLDVSVFRLVLLDEVTDELKAETADD